MKRPLSYIRSNNGRGLRRGYDGTTEVGLSVRYRTIPRLIPFGADPVCNFENNWGAGSDPRTTSSGGVDDKNLKWCTATIAMRLYLEFAMNEVVERILDAYQSMCPLDTERTADSRQKISRYIESLASAGQRDAEQLTIYGLAYLTELYEGYDPRFTGC